MITQQHRSRLNIMFLGHLLNLLLLEKRAPRTSQRTIRSNQNPLFLAVIHNFLLRQIRVVFDLIACGSDGCDLHQFFKVRDGKIAYADCFCFSGGEEGFHVFPGLGVGGGSVEVAGAVGVFGEVWVIAFRVHGDFLGASVVRDEVDWGGATWPMHEVQVDCCCVSVYGLGLQREHGMPTIVKTKGFQTEVKVLLCSGMEGTPKLYDILSIHL
jgi:hypothetical protein